MKRYYILLLIFVCFAGNVHAYGTYSALITKIENSFYGIDYAEQNDTKRLERLEETVYGESKKGDVKTRIDKLSQDISADLIGKEIKPKADTFLDDEPTVYEEKTPVADTSANYPVLDTMEEIIFKKNFKNSDVKNRITNLEKQVFNQVYPSEDLYSRVERLKASVLIEEAPKLSQYDNIYQSEYPDYDYYQPSQPTYPRKQSVKDYSSENSSPDLNIAVGALEKSILKKNYPNDDTESRISRMENTLFATEFVEDDAQTRINRLASAHNAQRSAKKYDNNKVTQNMSTIMQIGMTVLMILAMVL